MDRRQGLTAADLVNGLSEGELATLFWELGEERESRRIARAVVRERDMRPIESTRQLADAVERVCPRNGRRIHPASRVFQALRMRTNDELGALERGLRSATDILAPGGRLAVITFHSLEDRMVREFMRAESRDYDLMEGAEADLPHYRIPRPSRARLVTRKAILPSEAEIERNPRSRSAQLRVLEKI
jgi:16S rRNA (cytosine1402-N4)-methyltransferase